MDKTQTISVRELRQNLSLYLRATEMNKVNFVVMKHGRPIARILPEKKKTRKEMDEELLRDLREAQAQADRGELYTTEEARRMLGIPAGGFSGRRKRSRN